MIGVFFLFVLLLLYYYYYLLLITAAIVIYFISSLYEAIVKRKGRSKKRDNSEAEHCRLKRAFPRQVDNLDVFN